MAPKKGKVNGYCLFVQEYQDKKSISFPEAQKIANPKWAALSKEKKAEYDKKAKEMNNAGKRFTSQGEDVSSIQRAEQERRIEEQNRLSFVEEYVQNLKSNNKLKSQYFYIMHMHYYCVKDSIFYPAEVGIIKFNLEHGFVDSYHKIIQPGKLPLGSMHDVKIHSNETHNLPYPNESCNLDETKAELMSFLEHGNSKCPPVFVKTEESKDVNFEIVQNIFENFFDETIELYSIEYLFYQLIMVSSSDAISPTIAIQRLNSNTFEYITDISCEFHENSNVAHNCSLNIVTRILYTVCDNVCEHLNIKLKPGNHLPKNSAVDPKPTINNHHKSSVITERPLTIGTEDYYNIRSQPDSYLSFADSSDADTVVDSQEWVVASNGRNRRHQASYQRDASQQSFTSNSEGTQASASGFPKVRRPTPMSFSSQMSQLSLSDDNGPKGLKGPIHCIPKGRGRGRGLH